MRNRTREKLDYYRTPRECVALRADVSNAWDSCAGDGVFKEVLGDRIVKQSDINPRKDSIESLDFLGVNELPPGVEMVVVNPPFFKAAEFIQKAIFDLKVPIWALIRIEWLSTKKNQMLQDFCWEVEIVSELVKFQTEDGRVVNGNGTARVAWCLFKPQTEIGGKRMEWRYYDTAPEINLKRNPPNQPPN